MPVPFKEFKVFEALKSEYEQYRNFLYSVAVKIANSKDNRNEFEKAILKKIMVYKIYKASETDIVIKIIYARFPTNGFSEKIEIIKNMLSFAR